MQHVGSTGTPSWKPLRTFATSREPLINRKQGNLAALWNQNGKEPGSPRVKRVPAPREPAWQLERTRSSCGPSGRLQSCKVYISKGKRRSNSRPKERMCPLLSDAAEGPREADLSPRCQQAGTLWKGEKHEKRKVGQIAGRYRQPEVLRSPAITGAAPGALTKWSVNWNRYVPERTSRVTMKKLNLALMDVKLNQVAFVLPLPISCGESLRVPHQSWCTSPI